ncbi:hypothetical protein V3F56_10840 [Moorellaceae bacterium AZ2]
MKRPWWIAVLLVLLLGLFLTPAFAGDSGSSRPGWGLRLGRVQEGLVATVADILGLDREKVLEERHSGRSLAEIAETQGVDKDQLVQKVWEERQGILEQMVAEGRITREQANLCLENMKRRVEYTINRTSVGPPSWAGKGSGNGQSAARGNGFGQAGMGRGLGLGNGGNNK